MELKILILGHLLVISVAINVGFLYRECCIGRIQELKNGNEKNSSLVANGREPHFCETCSSSSTLVQAEVVSSSEAEATSEQVIDLDHGDPKMYERYWRLTGDKATVLIPGWRFISYFSDVGRICWFLEPEFARAVKRLHNLVGNAITHNRQIVVGTGSTHLIQAALYAISPQDALDPISVVSAAPFYSSYPLIVDIIKAGVYKWAGCANEFKKNHGDKMYIELVTSPNNPDGATREPVVNGSNGFLVYDLAYYWPQYTPITSPADQDIMLFTVSKSTGHAGSRIGWALVKDPEIAKKMTEYIMLTTIGVSKESQIRAAKIIEVVCDTHEQRGNNFKEVDPFFDHSYNLMAKRWGQLRAAVENNNELFSLPQFPLGTCTFSQRSFTSQPAFAWLECRGDTNDCESFLRRHKIVTRSGKHFGECHKYVRISMLPTDEVFAKFTERLSTIT